MKGRVWSLWNVAVRISDDDNAASHYQLRLTTVHFLCQRRIQGLLVSGCPAILSTINIDVTNEAVRDVEK